MTAPGGRLQDRLRREQNAESLGEDVRDGIWNIDPEAADRAALAYEDQLWAVLDGAW